MKKGIACGVCSHWETNGGKTSRVIVTHITVAAVKACAMRTYRAAATLVEATPAEVTSTHCGVITKAGHPCRNGLNCPIHKG
jgi:hypothetical protein